MSRIRADPESHMSLKRVFCSMMFVAFYDGRSFYFWTLYGMFFRVFFGSFKKADFVIFIIFKKIKWISQHHNSVFDSF